MYPLSSDEKLYLTGLVVPRFAVSVTGSLDSVGGEETYGVGEGSSGSFVVSGFSVSD